MEPRAKHNQTAASADERFVQITFTELDLFQDDPRALQVWATLLRFADYESMTCFPSKKTIARIAGCSVDSVDRALTRLTDKGLLRKVIRKSPTGEHQTNQYHLIRKGLQGVGASMPPPGRNGAPTVGAAMHSPTRMDAPQNNNHRTRITGNDNHTTTTRSRMFEERNFFFEGSNGTAHASALARNWNLVLTVGRRDIPNLTKIAQLVAIGELEEAEPVNIIECMVQNGMCDKDGNPIKKPMAYFMDSLRDNLAKDGVCLQTLMQSCDRDRGIRF